MLEGACCVSVWFFFGLVTGLDMFGLFCCCEDDLGDWGLDTLGGRGDD